MNRQKLRSFARQFRENSTPAESKAWELLRNRRLLGLKFRRQHPLRGFVVDFYCHKLRLVLEIDGAVHSEPEQQDRDRARDHYLRSHGFTVIRIPNESVTAENLVAAMLAHPPSPHCGEGVRG